MKFEEFLKMKQLTILCANLSHHALFENIFEVLVNQRQGTLPHSCRFSELPSV